MNSVQPLTLRSRSGTTKQVLAYLPNEECASTLYERATRNKIQIIKDEL